MKITPLIVFILLTALASAQIVVPASHKISTPHPFSVESIINEILPPHGGSTISEPSFGSLSNTEEQSIDTFLYEGSADINVEKGVSNAMKYYITFFPWKENCNYRKCFYGYVNNFTRKTTKLEQMSPTLSPLFKEIIDISSEKFNPEVQSEGSSFADGNDQDQLNFEPADTKEEMEFGSQVAEKDENISLVKTEFTTSSLRQKIIRRKDGLIGFHDHTYTFNIGSAKENALKLKGVIQITLRFSKNHKIKRLTAIKFVGLIGNVSQQQSFGINEVNNGFSELTEIGPTIDINSFDGKVDSNFFAGQVDPSFFAGQVVSPINIAMQFKKTMGESNLRGDSGQVSLFSAESRQVILDENKTFYEKSIFGKTFGISIRLKCDYIEENDDHKVQCQGFGLLEFFSNVKTLTLFDFTRSVRTSWEYNKPIKGQWAFTIVLPLIKPKVVAFKFDIKINYEIDVNLSAKFTNANPLTLQLKSALSAKVQTDSDSSIRVLSVEGGAFIKGTLVQIKTDPTITAALDFPGREISFHIVWDVQLSAFNAKWGFHFRYWLPLKELVRQKGAIRVVNQ